MDKSLFLDFNPHEEISDAISTSAASLSHLPCDDSPTHALSVNSIDNELGHGSKKIRKKRNAYQKIDDDIRLGLLEAVQRGETLKSAAKRYQVNYSSAKSIFHIFRKEGRILKKANNEKGFGFDFPCGAVPMQSLEFQQQQQQQQQQFYNQNVMQNRYNPQFQRAAMPQCNQMLEHKQERMFNPYEDCSGSSSPLNTLVDNFSDLLRIGNNPQKTREDMLRKQQAHQSIHPSRFNPSTSPTHSMLRTQQAQPNQFGQQVNQFSQMNQVNQLNQLSMQRNQLTSQLNQINQMAQITLASKPNAGNMMSPSERLKQYDNFYMNYSNSPLSGNSKMIREGSESGSNRNLQKEFESFSDMVTAFQSSHHLTESLKKTETAAIPKLIQTPKQHIQEKISEEDPAWNGTIENAALDTFKSFMDAQMVLSNAFKKASLLNNLVQIQKSKVDGSPSPRFISFQAN